LNITYCKLAQALELVEDLLGEVDLAVVLLLAAKLVTIAIPYAFKWATDALTGAPAKDVASRLTSE